LKKTVEKRDKMEFETRHKYGTRTLPKPRGWTHQRLAWLWIPIDGRPWYRRGRRSMEDTKKMMKCS